MPEKKLKKDIFDDEIDGNAFVVLGTFARQAKQEGWSLDEIAEVRQEAMSGDYDHLLRTVMKYTEGI